MSTTEEDFDRFSLVSSLYGPGSMGCWLCTLASVFVTWTLNVDFRRKDRITNDLLAALAIPAVAAGHVIFRLFFSEAPRSEFYGSRSELLTSTVPNVIQFAAAVEVPLNVCETFAAAALVLLAISTLWGHRRRSVSVLGVGLFCFSVESLIFFQAPAVDNFRSNLSRPYLFNFYAVMVSTFAFLGLALVSFFIILLATSANIPSQDDDVAVNAEQGRRRRRRGALVLTRGESKLMNRIMPVAYLPFATLTLIASGTGLLGATEYMVKEFWASRILFFVPKSGNSLSELDQAVSLAVGVVALLFSLYDA